MPVSYVLPTHQDLTKLGPCEALDALYDNFDDALYAGHDAGSWPDIEAWLATNHPFLLSTELIVGVLVATLPVQGRLIERPAWCKRARYILDEREGIRAKRILHGLIPTQRTS